MKHLISVSIRILYSLQENYKLFTCGILLFIGINSIFSQEEKYSFNWVSLTQSIDVTAYQGKKFRLQAAVKTPVLYYEGKRTSGELRNESRAILWARVDLKGGGKGFFDEMGDRPIKSPNWAVYSIEGEIDANAQDLFFGGKVYQGGRFYFDDFKLSVLNDNGQWESLKIKNPGFEEPFDESGMPSGWGGSIMRFNNYRVVPSKEGAFEGNYALGLYSDGYLVKNEHSMKEVIFPNKFKPVPEKKGLPKSYISALYQDQKGFIWIGTLEGLSRYDGYGVKNYKKIPGDSTSLSANDILTIFEDRGGNLWIGTRSGGVNLFNRKTEQFVRFQHDPQDSTSLSHNTVTSIYEDKDGMIWISGYQGHGLNSLNPVNGEIKQFLPSNKGRNPLTYNWINTIAEDESGRMWLGSYGGGIICFDRSKEAFFNYYVLENRSHFKGTRYVFNICPDKDGSFLLSCEEGFYRFNPETREFVDSYMHSGDNIIPEILKDPSGNIWLQRLNSLGKFDPRKKQLNVYELPSGKRASVISSLIDKEGIIWVGTSEGLWWYNPFTSQFQSHTISSILPEEYKEIKPYSLILEDEDHLLWIGTEIGLTQFNLKNRTQKLFRFEKGSGVIQLEWNPKTNIQHKNLLDSPIPFNIYYLHEDQQKNMWMPITNNGLAKWNRSSGKVEYYGTNGMNAVRYIRSIISDHKGQLWLGTWGGVFQFDKSNKTYKHIPWLTADRTGRRGTDVTAMYLDKTDTLWLGSNYGELRSYDHSTGYFKDYTSDHLLTTVSYGENTINCIIEDLDGNLWLGTTGRGLLKFDRKTRKYTFFTEQEGLMDNAVYSIALDEQGKLWMTTARGLSNLDPETGKFSNFNVEDGLLSENMGEIHRGQHTGAFYLGNEKGLMVFHPDSLAENKLPPSIVFSSLIKYNKDEGEEFISVKGLSDKDNLNLSYKDDILTFQFSALSYSKTGNNQYSYRILGLNNDWVKLGTKREITLSNVSPGRYTLQVKGSNGDGVWNEEAASLKLYIAPPWYWSPISKILYVVAFLSVLYALYRWRTREHRQKMAMQEQALAQEQLLNARLQQIDKLKDQFLANTTHELKTPLHGIIGLAESMFEGGKKSREDIQKNVSMILTSGRRLASLVNDILDFSRAKNKDIQLQTKSLNLNVIADVVIHSSEPLIGQAPVELKSEIPKDLTPVLADPNRLQQILYNLIGNAIKFTREGSVVVRAREVDGHIEVCVEDTGIGISKEKQEIIFQSFEQAEGDTAREFGGTGLGLSISKQLVELHGGKIWVDSNPGSPSPDEPSVDGLSGKGSSGGGSRFYFTLPISSQPTQLLTELPKTVAVTREKAVSPAKLSLPLADSASDRIKILVVDDEPINHQVLKNYLPNDQYLITSVMNGEEAMEAIGLGVKFDLVLLDVMMPRMSGYQVCEKIREKYLASQLPVIMVTAKDQIQDLVEGLAVGANDYLTKPFSKDEFLARINTQLDLHRIFDVAAKFVPNEFINTLGRDRITEVMQDDHTEKEVTIFYSDIRDYTTLSEKMTPTQNYKFISSFNLRLGPIIREYQGFVNRYLGDGFLAIFQKGAATALQAAIDIQKEINVYNEERKEEKRKPIRIGIGFHTGPLIMGIIGDQVRMDTAIVSDTVNTAARIEGLTKYYGANILFSGDSLQKMTANITPHIRYMGQVQVKGKQESLAIYECFAGDRKDILEKKISHMDLFKEGMDLYFNRDFAESAAIFQKILKENPEDRPARLFLGKAAGYIAGGVTEDWTGVEVMERK